MWSLDYEADAEEEEAGGGVMEVSSKKSATHPYEIKKKLRDLDEAGWQEYYAECVADLDLPEDWYNNDDNRSYASYSCCHMRICIGHPDFDQRQFPYTFRFAVLLEHDENQERMFHTFEEVIEYVNEHRKLNVDELREFYRALTIAGYEKANDILRNVDPVWAREFMKEVL